MDEKVDSSWEKSAPNAFAKGKDQEKKLIVKEQEQVLVFG